MNDDDNDTTITTTSIITATTIATLNTNNNNNNDDKNNNGLRMTVMHAVWLSYKPISSCEKDAFSFCCPEKQGHSSITRPYCPQSIHRP